MAAQGADGAKQRRALGAMVKTTKPCKGDTSTGRIDCVAPSELNLMPIRIPGFRPCKHVLHPGLPLSRLFEAKVARQRQRVKSPSLTFRENHCLTGERNPHA